ncbi:hypothetical protein NG895_18905 [Aeoliella sp. ICT_H6.2]|uniref:Uncharacterized protein n=1 Tax=Aeoliella straminimaris TaxID=2954799 RepID=A0A9X2JK70_9BACT|nr:hypothetical protein [Aeoliella straminimaris]MCO6045974.1 hypothetical protein [Aeoliella straminimaris]
MDKQETPLSMSLKLGYASIALGIVMVVCGIAWQQIVPDSVYWSEEDAREFTEASDAVHHARSGPDHDHQHSHGEGEPAADSPELEAAKQRLRKLQGELETAQLARQYSGKVVSIVGVAILLTGAALLRRV